jgi:hypothetical protein
MLTDANEVSHLVSFDLVEWISLPSGMVEGLRQPSDTEHRMQ